MLSDKKPNSGKEKALNGVESPKLKSTKVETWWKNFDKKYMKPIFIKRGTENEIEYEEFEE